MKKYKPRHLIPLILILVASLSLIPWFLNRKTPFREFCDTMFTEELSKDTLGLHFTLAHPEKFGINQADAVLPLYNREDSLAGYSSIQNHLNTLKEFPSADLSPDEQYTHNLLTKSLTHQLEGKKYFYLQEVFSPSGGTQLQYPILMAEYPFRCKKDIDNYLSLLKLTPDYFESLCEFEKEKVKRGYGMADYSVQKVIEQCQSIITRESITQNGHFLITTFTERLNQAINDKIITKKEATDYASRNRQYLTSYFLPAYENLAKNMATFAGKGKNDAGLSHYAQGREYYKWLFESTTGSRVSPEKVYETLAQDYYDSMLILNQNLLRFREENTLSESELSYFPFTTPEEMLEHLQKRMAQDFPLAESALDISLLSATVKEVSPALEEYTAPAYYLLPPLDDNSRNSIYINTSQAPQGLELYTTLAHEGYPGHLYQTTFYQFHREKENLPYLRSILNYGGYVEGWALYTELLSFDYAADLLVEKTGKESYRLLYDIYRTERRASLAMLSLLDVGIHYYGLDFQRVKEMLSSHGITNENTAREVFEYIVEEPANYPKYYWGYLEILSLKEAAKEQMGEYYSDYAFHDFYLKSGPSDFSSLLEKLTEE